MGNLSISPSKAHIDTSLLQTLWQKETSLRLLQLVELPMLDNLFLRQRGTKTPATTWSMRQRAFKDSQEDDWLTAALVCLEFLSEQQVVEVNPELPRAIIHSKSLAKEKVDLLVLFMLDNHHNIFKIPESLHKLVSDKLARVVQGKQPDVTVPGLK
ncbi:unnamed protein product [Coregonus sp. 'balchen']|nr:unnamed protein product [Coregonus sp. 'balchen']